MPTCGDHFDTWQIFKSYAPSSFEWSAPRNLRIVPRFELSKGTDARHSWVAVATWCFEGVRVTMFVPISLSVLVRSSSRVCEYERLVNVFLIIFASNVAISLTACAYLMQYRLQEPRQRHKSRVDDDIGYFGRHCNHSGEAPAFV